MEQLSKEVLNAFGQNVEVITNIQRFATHVCKIDDKTVCIKKFKGTENDAVVIHNIKNKLLSKNFNLINKDILTVDKQPYYIYNEEIYVCYENIEGEKINFTDRTSVLYLLAELGRLHKCLNSTNIKECKHQKIDIHKSYEHFKKLKKQVSKNNKKNNIDFMFLKMYNKYNGILSTILKDLEFLDFENYENTSIAMSDICFNSFDENNFVIQNNGIIFKDFSRAKSGVQLLDVVKLIYKYFKTCTEEDVKPININYLVDSYSRNNELTEREKLILQALLNYPEKYLESMNKYYQKKRSFVPTETISKLEKHFKLESSYYDYIDDLDI